MYCYSPYHQLYTVSQYYFCIAANPVINCIQSPNISYVLLQTLISPIVYSLLILLMYCYKPCHQLYTVSQYYLCIATNPVINCIQSPNITYLLLQTLSSIVYSLPILLMYCYKPCHQLYTVLNITYVLLQTLSSIAYSLPILLMYCYKPCHQLYTVLNITYLLLQTLSSIVYSLPILLMYCYKPCHQLYTVLNITYVLLQTLSSIVYSLPILLIYCYKPCHQLYTVSQYDLCIATNPIINCIQSLNITYLTRFNKIATQGAPQMAVDKEANSLSRVYSYYSKFNLRLFYV